ncbi:hypothetical protein K450DRAFT_245754 [Umbelopsis ramanniana AG]|uniref:Uncharacterized protein n=1 Tax=Umbelopsis ramanniana AG TaxID=1314678 RepID=A0AAD5HBY3_UMBRA|nr:uncharacterized protein K450DRAFT_245754 [Umbelopsis ramanniana AG]KAI8578625.1 hypothetical protein K450DRAFT_245754 [Umbelopsis ramanniana AG]
MYFNLPVDQSKEPQRSTGDPWDSSNWTEQPVVPTPNMSNIRDESFSSILANLNEHKLSPPLVTPNTLTHLLNFHPEHSRIPKPSSLRPKYVELIQNIKSLAVALHDRGGGDDLVEAINNDKKINGYLGPYESTTSESERGHEVLDAINSILSEFVSPQSSSKLNDLEQSTNAASSIAALLPSLKLDNNAPSLPSSCDSSPSLVSAPNTFV